MANVIPFGKPPKQGRSSTLTFEILRVDQHVWHQFLEFALESQFLVLQALSGFESDNLDRCTCYAFITTFSRVGVMLGSGTEGPIRIELEPFEVPVLILGLQHFLSVGRTLVNEEYEAKRYERNCAVYMDKITDASKYFLNEAYYLGELKKYAKTFIG